MAHDLIKTVQENAERWNKFIAYINSEKGKNIFNKGSDVAQKLVQSLNDYVKYEDFNINQKNKYKQATTKVYQFYRDKEGYEELQEFVRIFNQYAFTNKDVFESFQNQLGGKQEKNQEHQGQREQYGNNNTNNDTRKQRQQEREQREQRRTGRTKEEGSSEQGSDDKKKNKKNGILIFIIVILIYVIINNIGNKNNIINNSNTTEVQNNVTNDFPLLGRWKLTGKDSYNNWTADLFIEEKNGNKFSGYFDWYRSGNYAGKEYYQGEYNSNSRTVVMKGSKLVNAKNLALGTYEAYLNNHNFESGKWGGGAISGTWQAVFLNKTTSIESKKVEPKETNTRTTTTPPISAKDYIVKVETAVSNAISACENGNWDDAYKLYTEAASYPTDRSNQIKQTAAKKFYEKAKGFIDRNGECDDLAKKLLKYANNLHSSNEISNLLNRCNTGTASSVSSHSSKFPQASERLLSASDLSGLSKLDLKIMRNEIFARHGYIFKTNDMKKYFQNQSWYSPRYNDVNSMLSNIEKQNIALIQRYE